MSVATVPEEKEETLQSDCNMCHGKRWHRAVRKYRAIEVEGYQCAYNYYILQCLGCREVSFRKDYEDYEAGWYNHDDEYDFPVDTETYPKSTSGTIAKYELHHIPVLVAKIYKETVLAINEGARILAGLGLRGTVEAICIDQNLKAPNLEQLIDELVGQGVISKKDSGTVACDSIPGQRCRASAQGAYRRQIAVALKIVEHAIRTIYILKHEADELETTIGEYDNFLSLLDIALAAFNPGDEYSISHFMGNNYRRVKGNISEFEKQLIDDIQNGRFTKLAVGQTKVVGQKKPIQLFKIV